MDGPIELFVLLLVIGVAIGFRWVAGSLDRDRIREYVESGGSKVLDISSNPFGPCWWGSRERIYDVTYQTRHGQVHTGTCKTMMFGGVYWTGDAPPSRPVEKDETAYTTGESIACLKCGSRIPAQRSHCPKCGWSYLSARGSSQEYRL